MWQGDLGLQDLTEQLDNSENFGDVFEIVKKSVREQLGKERAGLMLVLADLPMHLGAFHGVGTNSIVMNRTLLDRIVKGGNSRIQVNSFVYSILLHEYLHSLGLIEETDVRSLVRDISSKTFGNDHPASKIATAGPWSMLPRTWSSEQADSIDTPPSRREMELVKDFDRSHSRYIS
jgi:hypothetical protein